VNADRDPEGQQDAPLLSLQGIKKAYPGVQALNGVDFDVRRGEVHALVGENGAGKSTLIKIIAGAEQADGGTILRDGEQVEIDSTQKAFRLGIATVYQEPQILSELTGAGGNVSWSQQRRRVEQLLERLDLDPRLAGRRIGGLTVAEQQLVLVAKALSQDAEIIIFDEPSAILTGAETEKLFAVMRRLREEGAGLIYISHRLDEIFEVCDRVTIMRDGEVVAVEATSDLTGREIATLMAGRELEDVDLGDREVTEDVVLSVSGLRRHEGFEPLDFEVRLGEILGLYGLIGSGVTEVGHALFGISPADDGHIELAGERVGIGSPGAAMDHGIALLPKDRKAQGIFPPMSVAYNVSISHLGLLRKLGIVVDRAREREAVGRYIERLAVKTPGLQTQVRNLSGGNQQKVLLARQLVERPKVLVLDEPTQGVDVGAKGEIHRLVQELAEEGTAIVVISSDLPEVLTLADRILVLRDGRVTGTFARGADTSEVLHAAIGGEDEDRERAS
jgi:rhamnose transport system ATP-binding protein